MARNPSLERFNQRMQAIPKAVREAVTPALVKSAEELAATQRSFAERSRDSGDLIDSIHVTLPGQYTPPHSQPGGSRVAKPNEVIVTVGNEDVRYAHLVEYGTVNAAAQPYFWPAVRLLKKRMRNRIKRAITKAVKEAK
jgi:HK97 gp10 family phage protein